MSCQATVVKITRISTNCISYFKNRSSPQTALYNEPSGHQVGAYRSLQHEATRSILLPPGWDASPSQGYPSRSSLVLIYIPRWGGDSHFVLAELIFPC